MRDRMADVMLGAVRIAPAGREPATTTCRAAALCRRASSEGGSVTIWPCFGASTNARAPHPDWQSLTTSDVPRAVERDPVVILPLAAIEQHGPHLPLSTDLDIGMGLLSQRLRAPRGRLSRWVLPPLPVGASEEHMRLPGHPEPELRKL